MYVPYAILWTSPFAARSRSRARIDVVLFEIGRPHGPHRAHGETRLARLSIVGHLGLPLSECARSVVLETTLCAEFAPCITPGAAERRADAGIGTWERPSESTNGHFWSTRPTSPRAMLWRWRESTCVESRLKPWVQGCYLPVRSGPALGRTSTERGVRAQSRHVANEPGGSPHGSGDGRAHGGRPVGPDAGGRPI